MYVCVCVCMCVCVCHVCVCERSSLKIDSPPHTPLSPLSHQTQAGGNKLSPCVPLWLNILLMILLMILL